MNILPVPGSISLPQKEHERRVGIVSPDRQLAGLARGLAEHEDVPDLDAPLHVARDDAAFVATVEDTDLDLDRFARHPGPADDLDDLRGNAVIVRHVLSLACPRTRHFFIARIFVETSFRPAAAGRHQSSAPRPQRSGRRSGAGYKRFATVSGRLRRKRESTLAARLKSAGRGSTVMPTDRKFCRFAPTDRPLQTRE